MKDKDKVSEEVEKNLEKNNESEKILEEVHRKFEDKLDMCSDCVNTDEKTKVCKKHKMMIAKYIQKKYKGNLSDIAKNMKESIFG